MWFTTIQLLVLFVLTIPLATVLAHALEFPGKLRLSRDAYIETQKIYYPGFTAAGVLEPLVCIALLALAVFSYARADMFWLTGLAAASFVVAHIVYWLLIHPVNKALLKGTELEGAGGGFFDLGKGVEGTDWQGLRDRWEYSHIARAILMFGGFMLFAVAIAAG